MNKNNNMFGEQRLIFMTQSQPNKAEAARIKEEWTGEQKEGGKVRTLLHDANQEIEELTSFFAQNQRVEGEIDTVTEAVLQFTRGEEIMYREAIAGVFTDLEAIRDNGALQEARLTAIRQLRVIIDRMMLRATLKKQEETTEAGGSGAVDTTNLATENPSHQYGKAKINLASAEIRLLRADKDGEGISVGDVILISGYPRSLSAVYTADGTRLEGRLEDFCSTEAIENARGMDHTRKDTSVCGFEAFLKQLINNNKYKEAVDLCSGIPEGHALYALAQKYKTETIPQSRDKYEKLKGAAEGMAEGTSLEDFENMGAVGSINEIQTEINKITPVSGTDFTSRYTDLTQKMEAAQKAQTQIEDMATAYLQRISFLSSNIRKINDILDDCTGLWPWQDGPEDVIKKELAGEENAALRNIWEQMKGIKGASFLDSYKAGYVQLDQKNTTLKVKYAELHNTNKDMKAEQQSNLQTAIRNRAEGLKQADEERERLLNLNEEETKNDIKKRRDWLIQHQEFQEEQLHERAEEQRRQLQGQQEEQRNTYLARINGASDTTQAAQEKIRGARETVDRNISVILGRARTLDTSANFEQANYNPENTTLTGEQKEALIKLFQQYQFLKNNRLQLVTSVVALRERNAEIEDMTASVQMTLARTQAQGGATIDNWLSDQITFMTGQYERMRGIGEDELKSIGRQRATAIELMFQETRMAVDVQANEQIHTIENTVTTLSAMDELFAAQTGGEKTMADMLIEQNAGTYDELKKNPQLFEVSPPNIYERFVNNTPIIGGSVDFVVSFVKGVVDLGIGVYNGIAKGDWSTFEAMKALAGFDAEGKFDPKTLGRAWGELIHLSEWITAVNLVAEGRIYQGLTRATNALTKTAADVALTILTLGAGTAASIGAKIGGVLVKAGKFGTAVKIVGKIAVVYPAKAALLPFKLGWTVVSAPFRWAGRALAKGASVERMAARVITADGKLIAEGKALTGKLDDLAYTAAKGGKEGTNALQVLIDAQNGTGKFAGLTDDAARAAIKTAADGSINKLGGVINKMAAKGKLSAGMKNMQSQLKLSELTIDGSTNVATTAGLLDDIARGGVVTRQGVEKIKKIIEVMGKETHETLTITQRAAGTLESILVGGGEGALGAGKVLIWIAPEIGMPALKNAIAKSPDVARLLLSSSDDFIKPLVEMAKETGAIASRNAARALQDMATKFPNTFVAKLEKASLTTEALAELAAAKVSNTGLFGRLTRARQFASEYYVGARPGRMQMAWRVARRTIPLTSYPLHGREWAEIYNKEGMLRDKVGRAANNMDENIDKKTLLSVVDFLLKEGILKLSGREQRFEKTFENAKRTVSGRTLYFGDKENSLGGLVLLNENNGFEPPITVEQTRQILELHRNFFRVDENRRKAREEATAEYIEARSRALLSSPEAFGDRLSDSTRNAVRLFIANEITSQTITRQDPQTVKGAPEGIWARIMEAVRLLFKGKFKDAMDAFSGKESRLDNSQYKASCERFGERLVTGVNAMVQSGDKLRVFEGESVEGNNGFIGKTIGVLDTTQDSPTRVVCTSFNNLDVNVREESVENNDNDYLNISGTRYQIKIEGGVAKAKGTPFGDRFVRLDNALRFEQARVHTGTNSIRGAFKEGENWHVARPAVNGRQTVQGLLTISERQLKFALGVESLDGVTLDLSQALPSAIIGDRTISFRYDQNKLEVGRGDNFIDVNTLTTNAQQAPAAAQTTATPAAPATPTA